MTLGLAFGDDEQVFGAEDSFGASDDGMPKKLIILANKVMLLTAGGMHHWRDALAGFSPEGVLHDVAIALATRLDNCMTEENQAYGLLCGFENDAPTCYRLNRSVGTSQCVVVPEDLRVVQPIGRPEGVDPHDVARRAMDRIQAGIPVLEVLSAEIKNHLSSQVAEPVEEARLGRE
jgi:hypothetical protein